MEPWHAAQRIHNRADRAQRTRNDIRNVSIRPARRKAGSAQLWITIGTRCAHRARHGAMHMPAPSTFSTIVPIAHAMPRSMSAMYRCARLDGKPDRHDHAQPHAHSASPCTCTRTDTCKSQPPYPHFCRSRHDVCVRCAQCIVPPKGPESRIGTTVHTRARVAMLARGTHTLTRGSERRYVPITHIETVCVTYHCARGGNMPYPAQNDNRTNDAPSCC